MEQKLMKFLIAAPRHVLCERVRLASASGSG